MYICYRSSVCACALQLEGTYVSQQGKCLLSLFPHRLSKLGLELSVATVQIIFLHVFVVIYAFAAFMVSIFITTKW